MIKWSGYDLSSYFETHILLFFRVLMDCPSPQSDLPPENTRLKANNVKKVLNAMLDYYADVLNLQMTEFPRPDPTKVAEGNDQDTGETLHG